jgi:hypothetical protein
MKIFINLIALTAMAAAGARAGDIVITFDNPNQTGNPGETLEFLATITNTDPDLNDAPIFLNQDSLNLTLNDATKNDLFFANAPIDLAPGDSFSGIELFDYTLADPESEPFGLYGGTYGLIGGADGGDGSGQDNLAQADFSVDVEAQTPEPGGFGLFSLATLAAILAKGKYRRIAGISR